MNGCPNCDQLRAELAVANQTAREFARRAGRLAARLAVVSEHASDGVDEFNDWSQPAATEA